MIEGISKISNVRFCNTESTRAQEPAAKLPEQANDTVELSAENKDEQSSKTNKTLLYALGAAVLAVGGYFLLRGKNSDDVAKAGRDVVDETSRTIGKNGDETIEKLSREARIIKTFEKNPPEFPKDGESEIVTKLTNGGKRTDFLQDGHSVSKFQDKDGTIRRRLSYSADGKLDTYVVHNKNGMPTYSMQNKPDGTTMVQKFEYNKEGRLIGSTDSEGTIAKYKYQQNHDGSLLTKATIYKGEETSENKFSVISTLTKGNETQTRVTDYARRRVVVSGKDESFKIFVPIDDTKPFGPGTKVKLKETVDRYTNEVGVNMIKITPADGGDVREVPFEDYRLENFFD